VFYFWIYLGIINVIAFLMYGIDKYKAMKNKWRISEAALIGVAALGGVVGAIVGMRLFRHKTKHIKFVLGVPAILLLWIIVIVIINFIL